MLAGTCCRTRSIPTTNYNIFSRLEVDGRIVANALQTLRARGSLGALNQTQKANKPLDFESLALLAIKEVAVEGLEPPTRGL